MTIRKAVPPKKSKTYRPWRDILAALGTLLALGLAAGVLLVIAPAPQLPATVRSSVSLIDAMAIELSIENEAEVAAREKTQRH